MKQIILLVVFAIATFFGSVWLIQYAFSMSTPSFIMHKETAFLAFLFPYIVHALLVGLFFGVPFGIFVRRQILVRAFLVVLPTPVLIGIVATWPENIWIPIVGHVALVLVYCVSAYLAHCLRIHWSGTCCQ